MGETRKSKIRQLSDDVHSDLTERSEGVIAQERNVRPKRITREYVHSLRGRLKRKGLLKALVAEEKKEREL